LCQNCVGYAATRAAPPIPPEAWGHAATRWAAPVLAVLSSPADVRTVVKQPTTISRCYYAATGLSGVKFPFNLGHIRPKVAHPGAPGQPDSRDSIAFLSLATYLQVHSLFLVSRCCRLTSNSPSVG